MTLAVLFKTHLWDEFVARRFAALAAAAASSDARLFVFIDQSHGFVDIPDQVQDQATTIHATEASATRLGLHNGAPGNLFWYCNDYPLFFLFARQPAFDHYLVLEYDAVMTVDLAQLIARVRAEAVDCVAAPIDTPIAEWHWASSAAGVYPPGTVLRKDLFSLALFSRRAVAFLLERRRALSADHAAGRIDRWPQGELFMATELAAGGFDRRPLGAYGDTTHFSWWPPLHEDRLAALGGGHFLHPVLAGERYVASVLKHEADLAAWFDPASTLRRRLADCPPADIMPALFAALRARRQPALIAQLKASLDPAEYDRLHARRNVALHRPATQSSVGPWSRGATPAADAIGGNNGVVNGSYGFHTDLDYNPWWTLDLEVPHDIAELRLFNRLDVRHRARILVVLLSLNGTKWDLAYARTEPDDFGGADGHPLVITLAPPRRARFVRIELPDRTLLHLDEVEVYGEPVAAE